MLFAGSLGAQAAGSTISGTDAKTGRLLRQMDSDMNGTVSKDEFLQFMGRTFDRLDTNRNGKLERGELRPLSGGRWDRIRPFVR
jgi:Ca2+-binding EF-hand superfamily protein